MDTKQYCEFRPETQEKWTITLSYYPHGDKDGHHSYNAIYQYEQFNGTIKQVNQRAVSMWQQVQSANSQATLLDLEYQTELGEAIYPIEYFPNQVQHKGSWEQ